MIVTSKQVKQVLNDVVGRNYVWINDVKYKVIEIRKANAGFDYAKIKLLSPKSEVRFLEFYWENNDYIGIALSKTIHHYDHFDINYFEPPNTLVWEDHVCKLVDHGKSVITEAGKSKKYSVGDIVHYWEYLSPNKSYRLSLGYNINTDRWINNCAMKLNLEDVKVLVS